MTASIPALLQPMKDRLTAATPGPWTDALGKTFKAVGSIADARLIVNAPTDQAKLIAAIEAVVAEIADTDLETNEALQGDLSDRILAALTQALSGDGA